MIIYQRIKPTALPERYHLASYRAGSDRTLCGLRLDKTLWEQAFVTTPPDIVLCGKCKERLERKR